MKQERSRAIIISGDKILLVKRTKEEGVYWAFPGGLIEKGEGKKEALIREVKEETGLDIKVSDFLIDLASKKLETEGDTEYFYYADIIGGVLGTGDGPELQANTQYPGKYEFIWYDISDLPNMNLYPEKIKELVLSVYKK